MRALGCSLQFSNDAVSDVTCQCRAGRGWNVQCHNDNAEISWAHQYFLCSAVFIWSLQCEYKFRYCCDVCPSIKIHFQWLIRDLNGCASALSVAQENAFPWSESQFSLHSWSTVLIGIGLSWYTGSFTWFDDFAHLIQHDFCIFLYGFFFISWLSSAFFSSLAFLDKYLWHELIRLALLFRCFEILYSHRPKKFTATGSRWQHDSEGLSKTKDIRRTLLKLNRKQQNSKLSHCQVQVHNSWLPVLWDKPWWSVKGPGQSASCLDSTAHSTILLVPSNHALPH